MGIGQAITMPLFFASNALYPVELMPGWLQVDQPRQPAELRGRRPARAAHRHADELWLDFGVLAGSAIAGIVCAAALIGRLAR